MYTHDVSAIKSFKQSTLDYLAKLQKNYSEDSFFHKKLQELKIKIEKANEPPLDEKSKLTAAYTKEYEIYINSILDYFKITSQNITNALTHLTGIDYLKEVAVNEREKLVTELRSCIDSIRKFKPDQAKQYNLQQQITRVPMDIWGKIYENLDIKSMVQLSQTSRQFYLTHNNFFNTFLPQKLNAKVTHTQPVYLSNQIKKYPNINIHITTAPAVLENGSYAVGDINGNLHIFNKEDELILSQNLHTSAIMGVFVYPDAKDCFITVSKAGRMRSWQLKNGQMHQKQEIEVVYYGSDNVKMAISYTTVAYNYNAIKKISNDVNIDNTFTIPKNTLLFQIKGDKENSRDLKVFWTHQYELQSTSLKITVGDEIDREVEILAIDAESNNAILINAIASKIFLPAILCLCVRPKQPHSYIATIDIQATGNGLKLIFQHERVQCKYGDDVLASHIVRSDEDYVYCMTEIEHIISQEGSHESKAVRCINPRDRNPATKRPAIFYLDDLSRSKVKNFLALDSCFMWILVTDTVPKTHERTEGGWGFPGYRSISFADYKPTHLSYDEIAIRIDKDKKELTAYWVYNGSITKGVKQLTDVRHILELLPQEWLLTKDSKKNPHGTVIVHVERKSSDTNLVNAVKTTFNCKNNSQQKIINFYWEGSENDPKPLAINLGNDRFLIGQNRTLSMYQYKADNLEDCGKFKLIGTAQLNSDLVDITIMPGGNMMISFKDFVKPLYFNEKDLTLVVKNIAVENKEQSSTDEDITSDDEDTSNHSAYTQSSSNTSAFGFN